MNLTVSERAVVALVCLVVSLLGIAIALSSGVDAEFYYWLCIGGLSAGAGLFSTVTYYLPS